MCGDVSPPCLLTAFALCFSNGYLVPLDPARPIVPHEPSAAVERAKTPDNDDSAESSGVPSHDLDPILAARLQALDPTAPDHPEQKALLLWGKPMVNPGKLTWSCAVSDSS